MNVDGVADTHPDEGARHLAVEGPIAERRCLREPTFELDAQQVDTNGLRVALADRRRHVRGFSRDIGFHDRLRRRTRGDEELTLHAGKSMAGHAAEINEVSGLVGAECNRRAGAFSGNAWRRRILVREDDIVLRPFAIDQSKLNHLSLNGGQDWIDLAVDRATLADISHAPFRDPRTQGVSRVGNVVAIGAGCGLRRLGRSRLWCGCGRGRRRLLRGRQPRAVCRRRLLRDRRSRRFCHDRS